MSNGRDDHAERGELLVHLRHALRKCNLLAEDLAGNPLVGNEARCLVGRLAAIRAELDALQAFKPELRHSVNDPFWRNQRRLPH